jgi:hypothetical protein
MINSPLLTRSKPSSRSGLDAPSTGRGSSTSLARIRKASSSRSWTPGSDFAVIPTLRVLPTAGGSVGREDTALV